MRFCRIPAARSIPPDLAKAPHEQVRPDSGIESNPRPPERGTHRAARPTDGETVPGQGAVRESPAHPRGRGTGNRTDSGFRPGRPTTGHPARLVPRDHRRRTGRRITGTHRKAELPDSPGGQHALGRRGVDLLLRPRAAVLVVVGPHGARPGRPGRLGRHQGRGTHPLRGTLVGGICGPARTRWSPCPSNTPRNGTPS